MPMTPKEKSPANYAFAAMLVFTALATAVVYFKGCVYESVDGVTHVFSYHPWFFFSLFFLFASMAWMGWLEWRASVRDRDRGLMSLVCGIVFAAIVVPLFCLGSIKVDTNGFVLRNDFFWERESWIGETKSVQFADLEHIRLVWGTRQESSDYYLLFERADGGEASKLFVDDRVIRSAVTQILKVAEERGVPISRPTEVNSSWWYARK